MGHRRLHETRNRQTERQRLFTFTGRYRARGWLDGATGAQGLGNRFMFNPPPPQPIEPSTPDLPKAIAWAALKAAYSPEQLGLMQVHEHMSERELNAALRSRFVPPTGLRLS